jgi:16S rRNA C967 or C1407 C5-methylase (RsmB/RsmF family)
LTQSPASRADLLLLVQHKEAPLALDVETLKAERDQLKQTLRELEAEQRKIEATLKNLRQRELKTKREIEALTTLVELQDRRQDEEGAPESSE